ncbi:MAG TPA: rhomboid family intramembrane serine protease, partial [Acidobacteriota bacterium]|nr:rhomboid family intramembrane serine protease [Acidobacteriota bacterium]
MRRTGNLNDWNRSTGGQGGWRRPLTPGVKYLMIFTGVAYLGQVYAVKQGLIDPWFLALVPERVIQGAVWQFITALVAYAISPDATSNLVSLIFGLLGFYFVGTLLEGTWGTRRFLWYYVRAGVATHLIAFLFMALIGQVHTRFPVSSATAVVFGTFLGSFGALFWEQQVNFNFVPLRGKTLVWIMTGVAIFMLLRGDFWWA